MPARVGLLDEARELQEALAFLARVGERAAHQVDVTDLGLFDHGIQRLAHAIERRRRYFDLARLLAQVQRAFVGCAIGAEATAHRYAIVLVQEVLAAGRDVDHQHVTVCGDAGLCKGQAVRCLLCQPRPKRLELDGHGTVASIVDQAVALLRITFHVPRRVAVAQDADFGAVRRVDEVGDGRDAPAGGVVLAFLEAIGVVVGHRVRSRRAKRGGVTDALAHHLNFQLRRAGERDHVGSSFPCVNREQFGLVCRQALLLRS